MDILQCAENLNTTERPRKGGHTLWAGAKSSVFSCLQTLVLLILGSGRTPTATLPDPTAPSWTFGLRLNYSLVITPPAFWASSLQRAGHVTAQPLRPHEPIPITDLLSVSLCSSMGSVPPRNPDQQASSPASLGSGYVPGRGCLCGQPPGKSLGAESPVSFLE